MDTLEGLLWGTAIAAYGVGDTVTSIQTRERFPDEFADQHPLSERAFEEGGVPGYVAGKTAALGVGLVVWDAVDDPGIIPAGYSLVGGVGTVRNLRQLERGRV